MMMAVMMIMDLKQRLRGYTYVMGHDIDETLMPAKHHTIKQLLKKASILMVRAAVDDDDDNDGIVGGGGCGGCVVVLVLVLAKH